MSHVTNRLTFAALLIGALPLMADVVIPSSAYSGGRNNAEFHSDVRLFNPSTSPVNVTPIFYDQSNGETVTKPEITIPGRSQVAYDNVLASLFGRPLGSFGPIRFQTSSPLVASSSVNNVNGCGNGSVSGQWLPGIDAGGALKAGTLVQLAASGDSSQGYRSNIDFINPGAASANVTLKIRKGDGSQASSATLAPIGPNGFFQKAIDDGTFPGMAGMTDTNLWIEFTSDVPVLAFASVIANASGDPFAIVMTPEPVTPPSPPAASYSVTPASASINQAVTFTDTSTNGPTAQLWAFGDGATATSGSSVTHAFAAAGTYKTSHFVTNAAGASSAGKDVVVTGTAAPVPITILMKQWSYEPNPLTLTAGTPYVLTFQATDVTHGIGGLAALGITACNLVPKSTPCVVNFTPTMSQVGTYTMICSQSSCGAGHSTMSAPVIIKAP